MKVNIGPYIKWVGPYQIADLLFFWQDKYIYDRDYGHRWDYRLKEKFGDWLSNTWVNEFCQWIYDKQKRRVDIRIDHYDAWSADNTLALIIEPLLKRIRDEKHGSPHVYDEDVPEELKSTSAPTPKGELDLDDNYHKRWEWVLGEMIWAFEQKNDDDADNQFHTGEREILWRQVDINGNIINDTLYKSGEEPFSTKKDDNTFWEMIEGPNNTHEFDIEGWKKWTARKQNGFRLFGKYYESLWD